MVGGGVENLLPVTTTRDHVVKAPSTSTQSSLAIPQRFYQMLQYRKIAGLTPIFSKICPASNLFQNMSCLSSPRVIR